MSSAYSRITATKTPDRNKNSMMGPLFFWLTVSKTAVHGGLVPHAGAGYRGSSIAWAKLFTSQQARKQRTPQEKGVGYNLQRPTPVTYFNQTEPHLLKTEQSLKIVAQAGGISIQNISLWRIFQN